jgi:hypothetical protein
MVCRFTHWSQDVGELQWIAERIWVKWNLLHHFEIKLCWAEFAPDVVKIWFFRQFLSLSFLHCNFQRIIRPMQISVQKTRVCRYAYKMTQICISDCGENSLWRNRICRFVYKFVEKLDMQICVQVCGEIRYADLCDFCGETGYTDICVKFVERLNNLSSTFSCRLLVRYGIILFWSG